jgi:hypothetical protein
LKPASERERPNTDAANYPCQGGALVSRFPDAAAQFWYLEAGAKARMSTDFCDAAYRHHTDAGLLSDRKSVPNADHLYGISAECSLKAVMIGLGAPSQDGDLQESPHRQHINKLWSEYQAFLKGRTASRYLAPLGDLALEPFADWRVDQRYAHRSEITAKELAGHAKAARACLVALERARADGRVTWIRAS